MSRQSARHRVNPAQLVLGLVYLAVAGAWALVHYGVLDGDQLGWLLPTALVVAGAVGLLAFVLGARHREDDDPYPEPGNTGSPDEDAEPTTVLTRPYPRHEPATESEPSRTRPHEGDPDE